MRCKSYDVINYHFIHYIMVSRSKLTFSPYSRFFIRDENNEGGFLKSTQGVVLHCIRKIHSDQSCEDDSEFKNGVTHVMNEMLTLKKYKGHLQSDQIAIFLISAGYRIS